MSLKKKLLLSATATLLALPIIANADLVTHNNTDFESAVTVTSGAFKGQCTGKAPGTMRATTPAHQTVSVSWDNVKALCLLSGNTCSAEIHMTPDCSDAPVATASLDLSSTPYSIRILQNLAPTKFNIHASGSDVFLDKA